MKINTDTMKFGTMEYDAAFFINCCADDLSALDEYAFECWLEGSWSREKIILNGKELKVPEREKKAILHFIAFWYYRNKKEPS